MKMWWGPRDPVHLTKAHFDQAISHIHTRLYRIEINMATQADLDALKASADAIVKAVNDEKAQIAALVAQLANTAPDDTAAIQAVTAELVAAVAPATTAST